MTFPDFTKSKFEAIKINSLGLKIIVSAKIFSRLDMLFISKTLNCDGKLKCKETHCQIYHCKDF